MDEMLVEQLKLAGLVQREILLLPVFEQRFEVMEKSIIPLQDIVMMETLWLGMDEIHLVQSKQNGLDHLEIQ